MSRRTTRKLGGTMRIDDAGIVDMRKDVVEKSTETWKFKNGGEMYRIGKIYMLHNVPITSGMTASSFYLTKSMLPDIDYSQITPQKEK